MPIIDSQPILRPATTAEQMLAVGRTIYHNYMEGSLNFPVGTDLQAVATQQILDSGYDNVQWIEIDDDMLLLMLWFYTGPKLEEWIIKFSGFNSETISVFQLAAEGPSDG